MGIILSVCAIGFLTVLPIVGYFQHAKSVDITPRQIIKAESINTDDAFLIASYTILFSWFGPKTGLMQSPKNYSMEEIKQWIPDLENMAEDESILWVYQAKPLAFNQMSGVLYVKTIPDPGMFFVVLKTPTPITSIKPR